MWTRLPHGKISLQVRSGLTLLLTCLMILPQAGMTAKAQFTAPDLEGFNLHDERDADGDGDGVNETHIKHYLSLSGDSIASMTTNGRLWAWSLDTRDNESGTKNYVIRDSTCDGIFNEVYGLDEEYHVPDCVKQPDPAEE